MPSKRKFYRHVFTIEVLAEERIEGDVELSELDEMTTAGECSRSFEETGYEEVDGPRMAKLLIAQGSDPGFFNLTDEGEDTDED